MKFLFIFSVTVVFLIGFLLYEPVLTDPQIHTYLQRSGPFVGTDVSKFEGIDGDGIIVAVIDTGVDFNHPDLFGWGEEGKVIGGYNFIETNQPPLDKNGHGTQVAGVIAADGEIVGIAPKAKILAYKVSEDGEGVSSDLIIKAIEKAVEDGADIINISLGVNKTNSKIENAVNYALEKEVFVVTAAGNDGPELQTIGSPGRNVDSVTVGATYNNLTSSLVATFEIDEKPYTVIPMVGSSQLDEPISGEIVFGGYGKIEDLENLDLKNSILLVERGSDVEGELLYFSIKEKNAAMAGVKALVVYNDRPGIFLGELIHEFIEPGYTPSIPVVSMDREEGIEIKDNLDNSNDGILHLFYNPDFVAHFSSRGPVSPFYIKPEIVAPGAYINTTQNNAGYNFTSGTSYAAPHVSGAAALLLQKNPELHHHEIKSILLTTVKPVSDSYGNEFSVSEAGAGRLDIKKAFAAKLIIMPPNFVAFTSSNNPVAEKVLELKLIEGNLDDLDIQYVGPEFVNLGFLRENNKVNIKLNVSGENFGQHEGRVIITHSGMSYVVPFLLHHTEGSITVSQQNQNLLFEINHPQEWNFAKISLTNSNDGKVDITTTTPNKKDASIPIYENGEYWIDAKIRVGDNSTNAFSTIIVKTLPEDNSRPQFVDLPLRYLGIIVGALVIIGIVGVFARRSID